MKRTKQKQHRPTALSSVPRGLALDHNVLQNLFRFRHSPTWAHPPASSEQRFCVFHMVQVCGGYIHIVVQATCHWKCPFFWWAVIYNASETRTWWQFHSARTIHARKIPILINIPTDPIINIYLSPSSAHGRVFWHCPFIASDLHFSFCNIPHSVIYAYNSCIINFEFTTKF